MTISVVIPAYNEEQHIRACLKSLQSQTRPADEIIVVDNNCSDQTATIAREMGVRVIEETKQGIWAAARAGYDAAGSDIIARCDVDSRLPRDWLERIEQNFINNPHIIAVTGPGKFYDTTIFNQRLADIFYMKAYFVTVGAALRHPPLFGSNFALKRAVWRSVRHTTHHTREDIHDDIDFSYHLGRRAAVYYDKQLIVGISFRPFRSLPSLARRYRKGLRSIVLHWPQDAPWRRIFNH